MAVPLFWREKEKMPRQFQVCSFRRNDLALLNVSFTFPFHLEGMLILGIAHAAKFAWKLLLKSQVGATFEAQKVGEDECWDQFPDVLPHLVIHSAATFKGN